MRGSDGSKLKNGCSLDDEDEWHQLKHGRLISFLFFSSTQGIILEQHSIMNDTYYHLIVFLKPSEPP